MSPAATCPSAPMLSNHRPPPLYSTVPPICYEGNWFGYNLIPSGCISGGKTWEGATGEAILGGVGSALSRQPHRTVFMVEVEGGGTHYIVH